MKTALIMGITGGFGGHVAQALVERGWSLKVLMRDPAKLPQQFASARVTTGDAGNLDDVRTAAQDVDLLVYGINPANYQWEGKALPWLENAVTVAEDNKLTMVFPGNVYVFDPSDGPEFDETAAFRPVSSKGKMRVAMEQRLQLASQRGAKVIIVRCGDFIGSHAPSTWIQQLIKPNARGYTLSAPGSVQLAHTWAYLPDVAQTVAELVANKNQRHAFDVFHFKGYRITFKEMAEAVEKATGKKVVMKKFPWWALRLMSPFSSLFRSLIEMRYLWEHEINLSEEKLQATLDKPVPHTQLGQALIRSGVIEASNENPKAVRHGDASI
ncbi:MAG: NmrA family NAD(P)-binding protein [Gammaproteobacteria bacterium]|nr:NmrA family NAD(P)-binding protein [Gammaproteobacteria bacterium]